MHFGGNGGTWIDSMWVDITTISCLLAEDSHLNNTPFYNKISLSPNPTKGILQVHSDELIQAINIYDLTGRHLRRLTTNQKVEQLDFSNFEQGIYILRIQTQQGIYSQKVQYH